MGSEGYSIINEFTCGGWNANSLLKLFGGINKGKPDAHDLKDVEESAEKLKKIRLAWSCERDMNESLRNLGMGEDKIRMNMEVSI